LEILKRAKGDSGDLVSWNADKKQVREEVNRRTAKAGYTTKYGERPFATRIQNVIPFGETKINVWPRDEHGNLIGD
jgi:hypothetical protein